MSLAVLVRDRLRAELIPDTLKMVEGAAEWSALKAPPPAARTPCAHVMLAGFDPGPNGLAGGPVRQNVERTISVVLTLSNLRDLRGEAAAADMDALLLTVIGTLHGWKPSEADTALLLGAGELLDASAGIVTWQQQFTSERLFTKV